MKIQVLIGLNHKNRFVEEIKTDYKTLFIITGLIFSALFSFPSFQACADDDHEETQWDSRMSDGEGSDDNGHHQKRKKNIAGHLKSYSAEHSTSKCAKRILQSLGNQVPLRITQTPYIRQVHHEISANVLNGRPLGLCQIVLPATQQLKRVFIMMTM